MSGALYWAIVKLGLVGYTVLRSFVSGLGCNLFATGLVATFYHNDPLLDMLAI